MVLPALLGLATLAVPVAIGLALGVLVRRLVPARLRPWVRSVGAAGLALAPLLLASTLAVGVYDALLAAAACSGAMLAASLRDLRAPPWRGVAIALATSGLGVLAVEAVARHLGGRTSAIAPSELHLRFEKRATDFACMALQSQGPAGGADAAAARTIVHLGDSMVAAYDVLPDQRFAALVQRARPGERHLVEGHPGVGPDVYFHLVATRIAELRPAAVYLYVFLGNDFFDMDRPHACCGDGHVLDYAGGRATLACASPRSVGGFVDELRAAPAPYALRVLAHVSVAANVLASRFDAATHLAGAWTYHAWEPTPQEVEHVSLALRAIHEHLRSRGIDLTLVLLPPRWPLETHERGDPFARARAAVADDAARDGVRVLDAWSLFQEAIDRDPSGAWFQSDPSNPHFGVEGHAAFAAWLLERM